MHSAATMFVGQWYYALVSSRIDLSFLQSPLIMKLFMQNASTRFFFLSFSISGYHRWSLTVQDTRQDTRVARNSHSGVGDLFISEVIEVSHYNGGAPRMCVCSAVLEHGVDYEVRCSCQDGQNLQSPWLIVACLKSF
jgi:hypothetical protein